MPLGNHPQQTAPICLKIDEGMPDESRPVFLCRFLTKFEIDTLSQELESIRKVEDYAEAHRQLDCFLAKGVTGWRNVVKPGAGAVEFAPDRFDQVLTGAEKFELAWLMLTGTRVTELEKKRSSSPANSAPDKSAPDARAASAEKTS